MLTSFNLSGTSRADLNTELRFIFAGAKVDGDKVVRLVLPISDNEKERDRIAGCVIKVLRTLKKEKIIQFYVNKDGFSLNSTEASFLLNKYGECFGEDYASSNYIYVKM